MVSERWALVLAGGDGTRLRGLCDQHYDDGRPKQFCAFDGGPTMIECALERAGLVAASKRSVVSLVEHHLPWFGVLDAYSGLLRVVQPRNRGTGAGALASTLVIARECPDATVVALPADHWVSDDLRFMEPAREAAYFVEEHPDAVVLIGVEPTRAETDYGWLVPRAFGRPHHPAPATLVEKPERATAELLMRVGAYWNTLVLVFKAQTLLRLMALLAPEWFRALYTGRRNPDAVYDELAPLDLSRDILARASRHVHVMPARNVGWSDLGRPERVYEAIGRERVGGRAAA